MDVLEYKYVRWARSRRLTKLRDRMKDMKSTGVSRTLWPVSVLAQNVAHKERDLLSKRKILGHCLQVGLVMETVT